MHPNVVTQRSVEDRPYPPSERAAWILTPAWLLATGVLYVLYQLAEGVVALAIWLFLDSDEP